MVHFNTLSLALFTSLYLSISWNLDLPHFSESYLNLFNKYLKSVHINYNHSTLVVCFCDAWRWQNNFLYCELVNLWINFSHVRSQGVAKCQLLPAPTWYLGHSVKNMCLLEKPWKWKSKSLLSITTTMSM